MVKYANRKRILFVRNLRASKFRFYDAACSVTLP